MALKDTASQQISFSGSGDQDHDIWAIKPGDYIDALNFRNVNTESGVDGSGENISGNVLVSYTLPAGTNKCIGRYEDQANNTVFYMVWNSNLNHRLLRYITQSNTTGVIHEIITGSILAFTEWGYISHANLVGDLLYWTDGINPQRQINVSKADNTNKNIQFKVCFGIPNGTASQIRYVISDGTTTLTTDITYPNTLTTRQEAATTAYSIFGASLPILSRFTVENKGEYLLFTSLNSTMYTITVTTLSGVLTSWYKAMNWYPTITLKTLDVCAWPSWGEPDTDLVNVASFDNNFLNGKAYQFRTRIYYEDGQQSSLSAIGRMTYNTNTLTSAGAISDYVNYQQTPGEINAINVRYRDGGRLFDNRELVKGVELLVRNTNAEVFRSFVYLQDYELDGEYLFFNTDNEIEVGQEENARPYNDIPITSKTQDVVNNKLFYAHNKTGYDTIPLDISVSVVVGQPAWDLYNIQRPKYFGKYNFGIVYFDRLKRQSFVCRNADTGVIIPAPVEVNAGSGDDRPFVEWEIRHQPPIWATHYAWVRTRELTQTSYIKKLFGNTGTTPVTYYNIDGVATTWGAGDVFTAEITFGSNTGAYTFQSGDQYRFVFFNSVSFVYIEYYDTEIISYDPATFKMIVAYPQQTNTSLIDIKSVAPVYYVAGEIYTPYKNNENEPFFEFYETYGIIDPGTANRYHGGGFEGQNQTAVLPATGTFYYGWDTFNNNRTVRLTTTMGGYSYWGETNVTNFVTDTIVSGIGRVQAENPDGKQVTIPEDVCFSDVYNVGTAYNGFGTFLLLSHKQVPSGFGGINLLKNMDNILVAVCSNKSFSLYIDKGIFQGQDGTPTISISDAVIGAIRDLNGTHGTENPESFAINDGLLFWWDVYRGEICQYSGNGIDVVSKYNMVNYFAQKGRDGVKALGDPYKVLGVIHKPTKEYIIHFPETSVDSATQAAVTRCFNYAANGWKTKYSFLPEMMCGIGVNFVSFKNGALWLHTKSATKNTFYGVTYPTEVIMPVNISAATQKTFNSISVESNRVPNFPEIFIPANDWNASGQLSELLEGDFELMNSSYFASFFMNKLTPNFPSQAAALIDGEPLQGQTMLITLSRTGTTLFTIRSAEVYLTSSELTN